MRGSTESDSERVDGVDGVVDGVVDPAGDDSRQHSAGDERWTFDESVAGCFEDMLARSIPGYQTMREIVTTAASAYLQQGGLVVDLGTSHGEGIIQIARACPRAHFLGIETSEPMMTRARECIAAANVRNDVRLVQGDLRDPDQYPTERAQVVLSVLTLQFIPIEHRQRIIYQVRRSLSGESGALILVEKVLGASAPLDALMVESYHTLKIRNGYDRDEVRRKALALEGVLVPVTARMNEELLRGAGFAQVDCIWRHYNFAAWVALP